MSELNQMRATPERRVLGELGNSKPEPISPTANLRLLTTLASSLNNVSSSVHHVDSSQTKTLRTSTETRCSKLLPRKEKSLSLLCNKFLNLYPLTIQDNVPQEISLNTTAKILNTEKRRIYDIINVLESLEMASKAGKNQYLWHGHSRLPATLTKLKMLAIKLGLKEQIQEIQRNNRAVYADDSDANSSSIASLLVPQSPIIDYCLPDNAIKEDKSLGVMCQKFVMLFLISLKNGVINLDIAAKVLISEPPEQSSESADKNAQAQYKTKVRRLYDIANVLSAIGLIEKVDLYNCTIRKPIFKYKGPHVECSVDPETPITDMNTRSIVGMATPSKNNPSMIPRATNRCARLCLNVTPTPGRREPRKRKLFGSDDTFSYSNNTCLSKTSSLDRLDDSILQVAEMELKRIKSSEDKPKVCTKLFPRHNSDSCISTMLANSEQNTNVSCCTNNQSRPTTNAVVLPAISKENLVNGASNVTTPLRTVCINVPLELKISPYCIHQSSTTPKFVKLANFDAKKLIPLARQEVQINVPNGKPSSQVASTVRPNLTILTKFPSQTIAPGDTFKAVKVGNTVQLVPMGNPNSITYTNS